jgi:hypothetical protein
MPAVQRYSTCVLAMLQQDATSDCCDLDYVCQSQCAHEFLLASIVQTSALAPSLLMRKKGIFVHYQDDSSVHLPLLYSRWHILVNIQWVTVSALADWRRIPCLLSKADANRS